MIVTVAFKGAIWIYGLINHSGISQEHIGVFFLELECYLFVDEPSPSCLY